MNACIIKKGRRKSKHKRELIYLTAQKGTLMSQIIYFSWFESTHTDMLDEGRGPNDKGSIIKGWGASLQHEFRLLE